jgi:hypothetical protein
VTAAAPSSPSSTRDRVFLIGSSLLALLLLVPWAPSFIGTQGDSGFTFMAHVHFARGTPWGTETLHTTGPWAMLRFPLYLRETFGWMLALHGALALWIAWILARIASRELRSTAAGVALVAGCLWLFFMSDDSRWFFVLLTFPLLVPDFRERRTSAPLLLACLFLGLCFHVKGTFLIATLPLTIWLGACELRARRVPWHTFLVVFAVLAWNAAAGSEIRYIPGYVDFVLGGTSGNPENFSQLGPLYQPIAFLGFAGLLMLLVLGAEVQVHGRLGWLSFLTYGAVVWMLYRTGFARQDTIHASRSFFTLAPFVACYAAVRRDAIRDALARSGRPRQLQFALAAASLIFAWPFALFLLDYLEVHEGEGRRVWSQFQSMIGVATRGYGAFDRFDDARRQRIRERYPLPSAVNGTGPIGVHGQLQTPIIAHGYENVPMPVVAAYENWNPSAVAQTVGWLDGDAAPQTMLMTSTGHSSETLRAMSERYEMIRDGWPIVLRRRDTPLDIGFEPLERASRAWGDRLRVPAGHERDLMRLKVRYERTWLNRLITFAYQPVPAYVVLYNGPTVVCRIRLNRLLAEEGLVLATKDFVNWDTRSERLQRVRHNLFQDIGRPNRMPVTAYQLQLLPALITEESREPGEKAWLIPGSTWRWYFKPNAEFVLERIVVPGRADWSPQQPPPRVQADP